MNMIVFVPVLPSFSAFFHHSDYHQGLLLLSLNHSLRAVSLSLVLCLSSLMNCWAGPTSDTQLTLLSSWQIVIHICTGYTHTHTHSFLPALLKYSVTAKYILPELWLFFVFTWIIWTNQFTRMSHFKQHSSMGCEGLFHFLVLPLTRHYWWINIELNES